jgi:transcriptional regulator with XRE-family HTH domain
MIRIGCRHNGTMGSEVRGHPMPRSPVHALGLAVRARREAMSLSQEALAERAGLHRTYVGGIERGERNLSYMNLVAVASALGVAAAQLVAEAEHLFAQPGREPD